MDIRLLGNFPLSQVAGCSCILLGRNSSISLAGSEEQINFSQQSPKMLKMASETFIHASLLFLGLFLKISRCVPLIRSQLSFNYLLVECRQQWNTVWQDHPYSYYLYQCARFKLNTMFPYKSKRDCYL